MARKKKKRSVWVREWILKLESDGAYNRLMSELIIEDPMQFYNFMRMKAVDFEDLAIKVAPLVLKQDTKFRTAICVRKCLAVTLRFLASGKLAE
ncbi:hypothetical protein NQ314_017714 [Rhamnusium bicolor]|uniref:Uncharacterized protein n=1 Tax=Rhamnusium bicolor TaxID=1586634 RepID=A0AAV8WTV5_9CUCU|nr:hypothetical protein NQ314_017714 [Rhamnusium bicolor]